jgi:hypothetical protein
MRKIKNLLALFLLTQIFQGCVQKEPQTIFYNDTLLDDYQIKIPEGSKKVSDSKWMLEREKEMFILDIKRGGETDTSISEILEELVNEDTQESNYGKTLIKKDTISFETYKGLIAHYSKNHNNEIFKVESFYSFAVLQLPNSTLKISSYSLGRDYSKDVEEIIRSLKSLIKFKYYE